MLNYYDSKGEVVGFNYADNDYIYVKNQQGDITDITNSSGEVVASYTYDPWGKVLFVTGSNAEIGNLNPFRYRSYYYDSDIQMYYLQSRYYDPEVCRFINCDDVNYIGVTESEISYNPFAYCENEPIVKHDPNGKIALLTCVLVGAGIGLIIGGSGGAFVSYLKYGTVKWKYVMVVGMFGVAAGAAAENGVGLAVGATATTTLGLSSQTSVLAKKCQQVKVFKYNKKIYECKEILQLQFPNQTDNSKCNAYPRWKKRFKMACSGNYEW